jgi:hypothetical protein
LQHAGVRRRRAGDLPELLSLHALQDQVEAAPQDLEAEHQVVAGQCAGGEVVQRREELEMLDLRLRGKPASRGLA